MDLANGLLQWQKYQGKAMPIKPITGKEIISRFDMVELYVLNNFRNIEINIEQILIYALYDLIKAHGRPHRKGNEKRVRLNFQNDAVKITFLLPMGTENRDLLRIRITNLCKWDWDIHHGYIRAIGDILHTYGIEYAISKAEIALDTLSESSANAFNTAVSLKWGRPDKLFNFEKGRKRTGGSSNGCDEYMSCRKSARQTHSYKKVYKYAGCGPVRKETLYRWELKLRRKYLQRKGINTIEDLQRDAKDIVNELLSFKSLDRRKLNREIRRAKDWRLAGKSVPEQIRMMMRNGLTRYQINKYYNSEPFPNIIHMTEDPDRKVPNNEEEEKCPRNHRLDYVLWESYVACITKG